MLIASNLDKFVQALIGSGKTIVAPCKDDSIVSYKPVASPNEINLSLPYPVKSAKEYFFSDNEPILSYKFGMIGKIDELKEPPEPKELIIFGMRPCEAAAYPIMDGVFNWDYKDAFYNKRRERNLVISVACEACDEFCFCTSVGLNPQSTEGSDILLKKTDKGNYTAEAITDKGKRLIEEHKNLFTQEDVKPINFKGPEKKFDSAKVNSWLEKNFEHPMWDKTTLPCIGCGACTFLCPTCHCFDIVDESNLKEGTRYKNWDSCQFSMFTVHASTHNPRDTQAKRFRQRIQHKFNYYPDKFKRTLCVGCGRCIRHCPADMSLLETLIKIDKTN
jgi:ferredoxin